MQRVVAFWFSPDHVTATGGEGPWIGIVKADWPTAELCLLNTKKKLLVGATNKRRGQSTP